MSIDVNTQFFNDRSARVTEARATRRDDGSYEATVGYDRGEVIGRDGLDTSLGTAALYSSVPAWHGLGKVIPGGISDIDTVLDLAGIDFQVQRVPAFYLWNGELRQHQGKFHTVRDDTGAALGVVGGVYEPIQNRSGFEFLQELVNDYGVVWESAGALRDGRKIFVCIRLPRNIAVDAAGINDEIVPFIAVINSHDGRSPLSAVVTPWRPVCGNTERFAVRDAYSRWTVRHTKGAGDRIKEARRALKLSIAYYEQWAVEETALARTDCAIDEFDRLVGELWPPDDDASPRTRRAEERRRDLLADMFTIESQNIGRTAYAAERTVTDYLDHVAPRRPGKTMTEEIARATAVMEGVDDQIKSKAHGRLMALRTA
ncbi:DUF932 domain-containing protein [Streptomyces sp. NPDC059009]|uniref:DUF932 domain-containing protein n=1 Tax=Streptomyces sp. NPDC059009 TaxID=3346694 RepID=UPI0036AD0FA3